MLFAAVVALVVTRAAPSFAFPYVAKRGDALAMLSLRFYGRVDKERVLVTANGLRDGAPFAFAGLWERWNRGAVPIESFTIITGEPNSLVADLHDRMPAILDPEDYDAWLTATDTAIAAAMLQQPFPAQLMAAYPVSTKVNSVKNDTPDLIEPIALDSDDRLI